MTYLRLERVASTETAVRGLKNGRLRWKQSFMGVGHRLRRFIRRITGASSFQSGCSFFLSREQNSLVFIKDKFIFKGEVQLLLLCRHYVKIVSRSSLFLKVQSKSSNLVVDKNCAVTLPPAHKSWYSHSWPDFEYSATHQIHRRTPHPVDSLHILRQC